MKKVNRFLTAIVLIAGLTSNAWAVDSARDLVQNLKQYQNSVTECDSFNGIPQSHILYSAYPDKINWNDGYTTVFVGFRKNGVDTTHFLQKITQHIDDVRRAFLPMGLRGYLFYIDGDYEIAFQNWTSETATKIAFEAQNGQSIIQDANTFLNNGLFEKESDFNWLNNLK